MVADVWERGLGDSRRAVFLAQGCGDIAVVVGGIEPAVAAGLPDHIPHRDDRDVGLAGDGGELAFPAAGEPDCSEYVHTRGTAVTTLGVLLSVSNPNGFLCTGGTSQ
ncbi:MAG: hypothetical protein A07HN63_00610 [uncultured archaeon A07HN63]|nr:MAG: hypothetical protein A07HN63_00610 [uncultured archaeon A07HN63]